MKLRYQVVDVFTNRPLEGNPLAVFPDAAGLDKPTMQAIARELNLSETAFVMPSTRHDCAARIRIFTPTLEMEFAGHPTIGSAFVLMQEGIVPVYLSEFTLELNIGPVPIRLEGARPCPPLFLEERGVGGEGFLIWLRTPPITFGPRYDRATCAAAIGLSEKDLLEISPQLVTSGNTTILIAVQDSDAVDRAWCDRAALVSINPETDPPACVFVFAPTPAGAYSRMFAPRHGVPEDPATGSSTGPLAAYMSVHRLLPGPRFVSEQGVKMGRRSILHVEMHDDGRVDVGGCVTPFANATCEFATRGGAPVQAGERGYSRTG